MTKAQTHQTVVNVNDEWSTPPLILEKAMKKYNIYPTLDVCATPQNTKFKKYFTVQDNSLTKNWDEDFFMNPPYSEIESWMERAWLQHVKYNVNALILVFSKTSTKWWHDYVEDKSETHFQKGRIKFLLNGVEPRHCKDCKVRFAEEITHCKICNKKISKSSPTYDSVWIIFRKKKINMITGCKGICEEYRTGRTKKGWYGNDKKRCTRCGIFIEYKGVYCPCCGHRLRTRPLAKLYKERWKNG